MRSHWSAASSRCAWGGGVRKRETEGAGARGGSQWVLTAVQSQDLAAVGLASGSPWSRRTGSACVCSPTGRSCCLCSGSESAAVGGLHSECSSGARGRPHPPELGGARLTVFPPQALLRACLASERLRAAVAGVEPSVAQMGTKLPERQRLWAAAPDHRGGPLLAWGPLRQAHAARPGLLETPPRDELMLDARAPWARLPSLKATPKTGEGKCGQTQLPRSLRGNASQKLVALFRLLGDLHIAA